MQIFYAFLISVFFFSLLKNRKTLLIIAAEAELWCSFQYVISVWALYEPRIGFGLDFVWLSYGFRLGFSWFGLPVTSHRLADEFKANSRKFQRQQSSGMRAAEIAFLPFDYECYFHNMPQRFHNVALSAASSRYISPRAGHLATAPLAYLYTTARLNSLHTLAHNQYTRRARRHSSSSASVSAARLLRSLRVFHFIRAPNSLSTIHNNIL